MTTNGEQVVLRTRELSPLEALAQRVQVLEAQVVDLLDDARGDRDRADVLEARIGNLEAALERTQQYIGATEQNGWSLEDWMDSSPIPRWDGPEPE